MGDAGWYTVARQQHKGPSGNDTGNLTDLPFHDGKSVIDQEGFEISWNDATGSTRTIEVGVPATSFLFSLNILHCVAYRFVGGIMSRVGS